MLVLKGTADDVSDKVPARVPAGVRSKLLLLVVECPLLVSCCRWEELSSSNPLASIDSFLLTSASRPEPAPAAAVVSKLFISSFAVEEKREREREQGERQKRRKGGETRQGCNDDDMVSSSKKLRNQTDMNSLKSVNDTTNHVDEMKAKDNL